MRNESRPMRDNIVELAKYRKRQAPAWPPDNRIQRGDDITRDALTLRSNRAREAYGNHQPLFGDDGGLDALIIRDDAARKAFGYDVTQVK
jgi:hypothetical protein